jgi:hypothetical protein
LSRSSARRSRFRSPLPEAARTWDEQRLQNYLSGEAEQVRDKMNVYGEVVEE